MSENNAVTLMVGRLWDGTVLAPAERTSVRIGWTDDGLRIEVDAPFGGSLPPPGPPGPTERLWEHEVVELFVVEDTPEGEAPRYTEIELSPHGHHLVLRLVGVRNIVEQCLPAQFTAAIEGERWRGTATVARELLPVRPVRCNAYRVSGQAPSRRYEVMVAAGGDKPDFHRLDRFAPWPL